MHKNSQKRFYEDGSIYFITSKALNNYPYFKENILCDLFIEELRLCKKLKGFELYAFCLNHDHFHLLIKPNEEFNISKIMKSFKENFSRDANKIINNNAGETSTSRLQYDYVSIDQSCLQGNNKLIDQCRIQELEFKKFDKIVNNLKSRFSEKHTNNHSFPKFQWQKSFHDHVIRNEKDFLEHLKYTEYNFQKHDFPKNWKYTSLNFLEIINKI